MYVSCPFSTGGISFLRKPVKFGVSISKLRLYWTDISLGRSANFGADFKTDFHCISFVLEMKHGLKVKLKLSLCF